MRFAINYSPAAAELVESGAIDVDVFKCPGSLDPSILQLAPTLVEDARRLRPVYFHFPINTARDGVRVPDWDEVDAAFENSETHHANVHLMATVSEFPSMAVDSVDSGDLDTVADVLSRSVAIVVDRYGADRVIVENCVYGWQSGKLMRACTEASVIRRVVDETGCGLLLDLSHARLSCAQTGIDAREYVAGLPVDRLRELHVTGTGDPERMRDSMPMNADDWALYEWACERIRRGDWPEPWAVAFEYGGIGPLFDWRTDPAVIAEQMPRLRKRDV